MEKSTNEYLSYLTSVLLSINGNIRLLAGAIYGKVNFDEDMMKGVLIDSSRISDILNELGNQTGYWKKTTSDVMERKMDEDFVFKIHKNLL